MRYGPQLTLLDDADKESRITGSRGISPGPHLGSGVGI
jgi:hypothetical protein